MLKGLFPRHPSTQTKLSMQWLGMDGSSYLIIGLLHFWHNRDKASIGAISWVVFSQVLAIPIPNNHPIKTLGENFPVNNCGMYDSFWKWRNARVRVFSESIIHTTTVYQKVLTKRTQMVRNWDVQYLIHVLFVSHFQNESYNYYWSF